MFTYLLHIEAEVLAIRFATFEDRIKPISFQQQQDLLYFNEQEPTQFIFAATATVEDESVNSLAEMTKGFWPLLLTSQVRRGDVLYQSLCEETFNCIVLGEQYGLVVYALDGRRERIGLIRLCAVPDENSVGAGIVHLREHFSGNKHTIVLG